MVNRAVVAIEAGAVRGFGRKGAGLLDVARRAFLFKHCMCVAQPAAAVDAGVFENGALRDPDECQ